MINPWSLRIGTKYGVEHVLKDDKYMPRRLLGVEEAFSGTIEYDITTLASIRLRLLLAYAYQPTQCPRKRGP